MLLPGNDHGRQGKRTQEIPLQGHETPYEKFKSIPNASQYLKANITFEQLDAQAAKMSDNDAVFALNNARKKLFKDISALIKKQA